MSDVDDTTDPDWDAALTVSLTPEDIIYSVFASADNVHTAWESCIDPKLIVADITAHHEDAESYCRYVEQEYVEDEQPNVTWHDWTVELKLEDTFVSAHWRTPTTASPSDWDWCGAEAEKAFACACILVGKRVRQGIVVEESRRSPRLPKTHH